MPTYKSIHTGKRVDDAVTKIPDSLPTEDGLIVVKADGSASEYISKSSVLGDKLDKQTAQTESDQIYGKLADGSQTMFNVTMGAEPTTIPRRDTAGRIQVADGVSGNDAVNFNQLSAVESSVSGLNIQNGTGKDSIILKYSGEVDATHFGNTNTGESAVVFGEANNNTANRAMVSGKMNRNSAPNSLIVGLGNGRGIDATPNIEPISGLDVFVSGYSNSVINSQNSGVIGVQNYLNKKDNVTIFGLDNIIDSTSKYSGKSVIGRFNSQRAETLFEVGNGESNTTRSNAFEVYHDGRAKVYSAPKDNDDIVRKEELDTKYDKTGGTIGGNVVITGDLTVNGTQHINNTENLNVENAMIYSNATGATLATNGGIGIKKNATDVYGIVYDPTSDSVKLGLGKSDTNGVFTFNANEGQPVAIRDDSSKFNANHFIKWNDEQKKLVDSGYLAEDFVDVATQQSIAGMKTFTDEVHFGTTHFSKDLNVDNAAVKIFDNQKDLVTQYKSDSIVIDNGTGSSAVQYVLTLPKETGTLLLNKFKYSTFGSSTDGDSWNLIDGTKSLEIKYQDVNSHSSIFLEKDYIELSDINGTGSAKISLASNVITLDTVNGSDKHKIIRINPDKVSIGNSTDTPLVEIDSLSAKFNSRPQVKDNGNYVDVALKSDLDNYVPTQSESADKYYAQVTNENGIISARIFQNGGEDVQNLTIDKNGVKVLGKIIATTDSLDTKVNKLAKSLRNQVYVRDNNGNDTGLAYTYTDEGGTIAVRNASGQLQVSTPSQDNDAANKKFVEDNLYSILYPVQRNTQYSTTLLAASNVGKYYTFTTSVLTSSDSWIDTDNTTVTAGTVVKILPIKYNDGRKPETEYFFKVVDIDNRELYLTNGEGKCSIVKRAYGTDITPKATGFYSNVFSVDTDNQFGGQAASKYTTLFGVNVKTGFNAEGSIVGGKYVIIDSPYTFAYGRNLTTQADQETITKVVFGYNNKFNTKAILEVGNGTDSSKANALEVLKDGRTKVFGTPTENNDVLRYQDTAIEIESSLMGA